MELSTGLRGSARQKARLIRQGRKISDPAVVPLFQQLHSTDAADPSYERMASVSESLFGETGREFDPDEGPIGRVGAGDESVEADAAHDPPVTFGRAEMAETRPALLSIGKAQARSSSKRTGGLDEQICRDCLSQQGEDP
jgi:hypothetical protein